MSKIVIEILSSTSYGQRYHSFTKSSVKIGRSYECDLILDDPFVSAEHLTVTHSAEGLVIRDLSSENGTIINKQVITSEVRDIDSGTICSVGRTRIKVFSSSHNIEETQKMNRAVRFNSLMQRPFFSAVSLCVALLLAVFMGYLQEDPLGFWGDSAYAYLLGASGVLFCGAAVFALFRLFKHRKPLLGRQISMMSMIVSLVIMLLVMEPYIMFYVGNLMPTWFVPAVFCFFVALAAGYLEHGRFLKKDMALAVVAAGGMYLLVMSDEFGYSAFPDYNYTIAPYATALSEPLTLDAFLTEAESVFDTEAVFDIGISE